MLSGFLIVLVCVVSGVLGTGTQTFLAIPGQILLGLTAILSIAPRTRVPAWKVLLPAALAIAYLLLRAKLSDVNYLARADVFLALGALIALGLGFLGGARRPFRFGFYFGLFILVILNVAVGLYHLHDPGFSLIPGYSRAFPGSRIGGLYTNPNHLCSFVALTLPLLLGCVILNRGRPLRRGLLFILVIAWVAVGLLTYSRAGLIGLGLSLALFLLFLAHGGIKVIAVRLPWWALAGILTLASVALVLGVQLMNKRGDELFDTLSQRQQMASTAFRQMQENPVFGTGAGSFRYLGNVYRSSRWKEHVQDTGSDFAHNDWIQLAAEYGMVGLILGLVASAWFFWKAWTWLGEREKIPASRPRIVFVAAAGAGVSSLLVHSFFDFNLHLWSNVLIASLLMGMTLRSTVPEEERLRGANASGKSVSWIFSILLVLVCLFQFSHWNLWRAEMFAVNGLRAEMRGEYTVANSWLSRGLELDPDNGDYLRRRGLNSLAMANRYEAWPVVKRSYEAKALGDFERWSEINPRGFEGWLRQALVLAEMQRYEAAEQSVEKALKLAPYHRVVHYGYAAFLFARAVAQRDREGVVEAHAYLTGVFPRFGSTQESLALADMMKTYLAENPDWDRLKN